MKTDATPIAASVRDEIAVGAVVCVVILVGFIAWRSPAAREVPMIDGTPVANYTVRLKHPVSDGYLLGYLAQNRKIVLPVLLEQMDVDDTRLERFMTRMWKSVPNDIRERFKERRTAEELRAGASWGLLLLFDPENQFVAGSSAPPSRAEAELMFPVLRGALSDTNIYVRLNAAVVVGSMTELPKEALELCRLARQDRHYGVRYNTALALSRLMKSVPEARAELKAMRADAHREVKAKVAEYLGEKSDWQPESGQGAFE